jgi:hypothetical protein
MEIFKQNEDVIDMVLTPKGRELLAKGEFKPHSYSFHDIDIQYESNTSETQSTIEDRIKNSTRLKTPSYFASGDWYRDGKTGKVFKKHNLANQLGDKILGNQYAPAWKINIIDSPNFQNYVVDNKVKTSKYYLVGRTANTFQNIIENEGLEEIIPQININYYYDKVDAKNFKQNGVSYIKTFIFEDKEIFMEIEEINSLEENDYPNFNLEIYFEASDGPDKGKLVQLLFNKEIPDQYSVENYLNISFDEVAEFQQKLNVVDIYGPGGRDTPTNCD